MAEDKEENMNKEEKESEGKYRGRDETKPDFRLLPWSSAGLDTGALSE